MRIARLHACMTVSAAAADETQRSMLKPRSQDLRGRVLEAVDLHEIVAPMRKRRIGGSRGLALFPAAQHRL